MAYGRHAGVPNSSSNPVGGVDARPASGVGKREVEEIDWEAWPRYFLLGGQDKAILETSKKTEIMAFEQGRASTLKAAIKASPNRVITIILQLRDNPEELFAIGSLRLHNLKTVSSESSELSRGSGAKIFGIIWIQTTPMPVDRVRDINIRLPCAESQHAAVPLELKHGKAIRDEWAKFQSENNAVTPKGEVGK